MWVSGACCDFNSIMVWCGDCGFKRFMGAIYYFVKLLSHTTISETPEQSKMTKKKKNTNVKC